MTDRETAADWVGRSLTAWDSNDPADVRALFTPDAAYRYKPFEAPHVGHDRITAAWLDGADRADDHVFSWETIAVDGDTAVVRGRTEYVAGPVAGRVYDDLWVVHLVQDGRARSFTEWWMERPAVDRD